MLRGSLRAITALGAVTLVLLVLGVAVAPAALDGRDDPAVLRAAEPARDAAAGEARAPSQPPTVAPPAEQPPPAPAAAPPAADPPPLTDAAALAAARRFAAAREGTVGFAVLDPAGRLRGLERTRAFRSASVSKAMLLVAVLRRARGRPLTAAERDLAEPMITLSDNDAADAVFAQVGDPGLVAVARAARMRAFGPAGAWSEARLTPADQARLFLRIDRLVPARHRAYALELLAGISPGQRWGIPEAVARRPGATVLFKGGWRPGLTHQVARIERAGRRLALAVMIEGGPSMPYDEDTIAGIARRVLIPASGG